MTARFELMADYKPAGDQPQAIARLVEGERARYKHQTLLGVTGSGKTFSVANVIADLGLPTLVISHNKTLAAQLYGEFLEFFPTNAVEYFVSYYDYYQPEAYLPARTLYIEKDADINEEIDRLRLRATTVADGAQGRHHRRLRLLHLRPGLPRGIRQGTGAPSSDRGQRLTAGNALCGNWWTSNTSATTWRFRPRELPRARRHAGRSTPRTRRSTLAHRVLRGRGRERSCEHRPGDDGEIFGTDANELAVYPAKHIVSDQRQDRKRSWILKRSWPSALACFKNADKLVEAQRLEQRTRYDLEMLREIGNCPGIENYSRHSRPRPGDAARGR